MPDFPSPFGSLSVEDFLRTYWQKKPLLVRNALPGFQSPLSPVDLAELACEEDVTARLILEQGGDYPWELRYGPFEPEEFEALPPTHWTLLVQEVDRHVPEIAALLNHFRFIPNWRLDDIMISYAPGEGGVGAHVDNYDVFLIQGLGQRRWQINHTPVVEENLVPDLDVSVLADFEPDAEWVLNPGDMLYLPPRIPHFGVALDDCMTLSVGLRAPSHVDLATGLLDHLTRQLNPLARYSDPDLTCQTDPGEIAPAALATIRSTLRSLLTDDDALDAWFGRFITEPKRGFFGEAPIHEWTSAALQRALGRGQTLQRSATADYAFIRHEDSRVTLFVSGEAYPLSAANAALAPLLTGTTILNADTLTPYFAVPESAEILVTLANEGMLCVVETE